MRIVPVTTFYVVEDSGRHIGFASISVDTVPHSLQVTEYLVTESAAGARQTDQLMVRLSRGLSLKEFESTRASGGDTTRVTGRVIDSLLVVSRTGEVQTVPGHAAGIRRSHRRHRERADRRAARRCLEHDSRD